MKRFHACCPSHATSRVTNRISVRLLWGLADFSNCSSRFRVRVSFLLHSEFRDDVTPARVYFCIDFLDVHVSILSESSPQTDVFNEPTNTHPYSLASSCHPGHTKRNIAYSQALRICQINLAKLQCDALQEYLVKKALTARRRGRISNALLTHFVLRAKCLLVNLFSARLVLLQFLQILRQSRRLKSVLFIDYHPCLPNITGILRKYQPLLHRSETMKSAVADVPIITFRHQPNLRKFLVEGKLNSSANYDLW